MEIRPFDLPPIVKGVAVSAHAPFGGGVLATRCIWISFYNVADGTLPDFCPVKMFIAGVNDILDFFSDGSGDECLFRALPYFAHEGTVEG